MISGVPAIADRSIMISHPGNWESYAVMYTNLSIISSTQVSKLFTAIHAGRYRVRRCTFAIMSNNNAVIFDCPVIGMVTVRQGQQVGAFTDFPCLINNWSIGGTMTLYPQPNNVIWMGNFLHGDLNAAVPNLEARTNFQWDGDDHIIDMAVGDTIWVVTRGLNAQGGDVYFVGTIEKQRQ